MRVSPTAYGLTPGVAKTLRGRQVKAGVGRLGITSRDQVMRLDVKTNAAIPGTSPVLYTQGFRVEYDHGTFMGHVESITWSPEVTSALSEGDDVRASLEIARQLEGITNGG